VQSALHFPQGGSLNPNPLLGLLYHWIGGLSSASCYLPFRAIRQWSWEIYWLLQGVVCWIVAPIAFAYWFVPGWVGTLQSAPAGTLAGAWFWGAMWGIGGLTFGLGVRYLGVALGYTIALGFTTAFGTLVPPLFAGELGAVVRQRSGQVILLGIATCLVAIVVSGLAGWRKEVELAGGRSKIDGVPEFSFRKGLLVATFAGVMSACFAYGLAAAKGIDDLARIQLASQGRSDLWQHLPALVVVLLGGFTTNFLWCAWLLFKNRTIGQYVGRVTDGPRIAAGVLALNLAASAAAGMLWYLQFFFYSMGETKMGRYSFSSWTLHMAGIILFATLWGVVLHEWKGTGRTTRWLGAVGFLLLLLSTVIIGVGNSLKLT
jgi:L-rhamnose-H+ transport protein